MGSLALKKVIDSQEQIQIVDRQISSDSELEFSDSSPAIAILSRHPGKKAVANMIILLSCLRKKI